MNTKVVSQELILDNMGLAYNTAQRFKSCGLEKEDIQSVAILGLVNAATTFDKSKGFRFSTYAVTVMRNMILNELRKEEKHFRCVSLDKEVLINENSRNSITLQQAISCKEAGFAKVDNSDLISSCLSGLTERESQAILLVVCDDLSQKAAGKRMGVRQPCVSRNIKSGLKKIRRKMHVEK